MNWTKKNKLIVVGIFMGLAVLSFIGGGLFALGVGAYKDHIAAQEAERVAIAVKIASVLEGEEIEPNQLSEWAKEQLLALDPCDEAKQVIIPEVWHDTAPAWVQTHDMSARLIDASFVSSMAPPLEKFTGSGTCRKELGREGIDDDEPQLSAPNNLFGELGQFAPEAGLDATQQEKAVAASRVNDELLREIEERGIRLGLDYCSSIDWRNNDVIPLSALVGMNYAEDGGMSQANISQEQVAMAMMPYGIAVNSGWNMSENGLLSIMAYGWIERDFSICYFGERDALLVGNVSGALFP